MIETVVGGAILAGYLGWLFSLTTSRTFIRSFCGPYSP